MDSAVTVNWTRKQESIFQLGKIQGALISLEKTGNFTQNTGNLDTEKLGKTPRKLREIC